MPSKLMLDLTEPGISDVVGGAKVGEPITLTVTVMPVVMNESQIEADVSEISLEQRMVEAEEPEEEMEEEEMPEKVRGMPMENPSGYDEGIA